MKLLPLQWMLCVHHGLGYSAPDEWLNEVQHSGDVWQWQCHHSTKLSCTSLQCHFIWSHICTVHMCWFVTCQLRFWQNDWDILRATAVTLGQNRYQIMSQHRNLTVEKNILPLLLLGLPTPLSLTHESCLLPLSYPSSLTWCQWCSVSHLPERCHRIFRWSSNCPGMLRISKILENECLWLA